MAIVSCEFWLFPAERCQWFWWLQAPAHFPRSPRGVWSVTPSTFHQHIAMADGGSVINGRLNAGSFTLEKSKIWALIVEISGVNDSFGWVYLSMSRHPLEHVPPMSSKSTRRIQRARAYVLSYCMLFLENSWYMHTLDADKYMLTYLHTKNYKDTYTYDHICTYI